jgi:CMP-N-acetylneuraminic acid synthetase
MSPSDIKMNVLGVIPARGGSKGIPRKNLYNLCGKPLIGYTIKAAFKASALTRFIVSTDSDEIAETAKEYGANVPFRRPSELATDSSLAADVMKHAIIEMEKLNGIIYDTLVMLQPTTPLRTPEDIDNAVQKLHSTGCDTVITMKDVGATHPARMYKIVNDKLVSIMDEGTALRPRQELQHIYIRSGDVYACRRSVIFDQGSLIGKDCRPIIIPSKRAVNIDSMDDVILAEYYLKNLEYYWSS